VSQATFANNYDAIFGKKDNMQVRVQTDESKVGQCGCGRSPTGKCIGWHGLSESDFQSKLASYLADEQSKNVSDSTQGG
jgi:hypothetical protein